MRVEHGSTHEAVRRHNLSVVLRQLHLSGPLSRSALASRTELNRSTIKALVHRLSELGLVSEDSVDLRGTPGRPSPMVSVRAERTAVLAVEIAVDSVAVATVGLGGQVHARRSVGISQEQPEPDDIVATVTELAADLTVSGPPIAGVGAAIVGIVRRDDGFVHTAPNLGWSHVALGDLLEAGLAGVLGGSHPPVVVANEADLGVLAEHARGAARGIDDVVYLSGEVGIGGGVVTGGRRLTGVSGYAGEIGHLPVNPQGRRCGCGGRGCWETEAGKRAFLRLAGMPDLDHGGDPVAEIVAAAKAGESKAADAVAKLGDWLGIGLAALVNVFNPDCVVFGGMYGRAYDVLEPVVADVLASRALTPTGIRLRPAALGADAALIGAAELAFSPLLAQPDAVPGVEPP